MMMTMVLMIIIRLQTKNLNLLSLAGLLPFPKSRRLFDTVERLSVALCRQIVPFYTSSSLPWTRILICAKITFSDPHSTFLSSPKVYKCSAWWDHCQSSRIDNYRLRNYICCFLEIPRVSKFCSPGNVPETIFILTQLPKCRRPEVGHFARISSTFSI